MRRSNGPGGVVARASGASDLDRLEKILEMMDRYQVADFEWEQAGERLHLRTQAAVLPAPLSVASPMPSLPQAAAFSPASVTPPQSAAPGGAKAAGMASNQKQITSPFVGTFYRSPSPTAQPYAREGQEIKKGDVLCIIEAMKLMNEIESELSGKIVSILVENGQPVEFGEPLFLVET